MGCGNSKLNSKGELIPGMMIHPVLLRNKFAELRKRKNGDATLSKKVLLNDGDQLLEEEINSSSSSSMLLHNNNNNNNNKNKNRKSSSSSMPCLNKNDEAQHSANNNLLVLEDEARLDHDQFKQVKTIHQHKNVDNDEDEEEGRGDNNNEETNRGFICPGSPSFRVYFVEDTESDKEINHVEDVSCHSKSPSHDSIDESTNCAAAPAAMEDGNVSHTNSPSHASHDSMESTTSAKSGEGHKENKTTKKGKKGTSFSRKRPIGVGVGVKNLLNVRSCYHLSCSGGSDRANLLARKPEP